MYYPNNSYYYTKVDGGQISTVKKKLTFQEFNVFTVDFTELIDW